jgi:hypothetical protein
MRIKGEYRPFISIIYCHTFRHYTAGVCTDDRENITVSGCSSNSIGSSALLNVSCLFKLARSLRRMIMTTRTQHETTEILPAVSLLSIMPEDFGSCGVCWLLESKTACARGWLSLPSKSCSRNRIVFDAMSLLPLYRVMLHTTVLFWLQSISMKLFLLHNCGLQQLLLQLLDDEDSVWFLDIQGPEQGEEDLESEWEALMRNLLSFLLRANGRLPPKEEQKDSPSVIVIFSDDFTKRWPASSIEKESCRSQ